MEGSHNHHARRAQTSLNPDAPSTSYQVNVKRNKTRKWVEAKVQNYDGDDWGADEYEEESDDNDSSATPPPPINPSLRTFSGTDLLHSRRNTPSPASSLSALPSLRSQVPQPPAVPPASESPRIAVASPDVSDLSIRSNSDSIANDHVVSPQSVQGRDGDGSNQSLAGIAQLPSQVQQQQQGPSGFNVSRTSSFEQAVKPTSTPPAAGDRFMTPLQHSATSPPPVIYSPDNYSRLPDDNEDHTTLALAPTTTAGSDQAAFAPNPLARTDTRDTWERDEEPSSHVDQPGGLGTHPDVVESQIDRGRMSVSPKLPDVSRMSVFGADLFSSSTSNNVPKEPVINENQGDRGEEPAASPAAPPPVIDYNQTTPPAESQDHSEVLAGAPLSQSADLFPGRNIPSIPPLRTPSPHEPRTAVPMFDSHGTKVTPTEPLQPGREESLADVENPQLFQRMQTYSTSTSSPVKDSPLKENDVLSDEIMRTLSPSGATAAEVKPLSDGPQLHPAGDRSAVRESSYTLGDYDSYWADATSNLDDASEPPPEDLATPQPPQQPAQQQQQGEGEDETLDPQSSLRRRFSWEDEQRTPTGQAQAQAQAQTPTSTPASLPAPPTDDGSSAPAVHLTAPSGQAPEPSVNLSNESRSHSPVSQLSQAPPAGSGVGAPLALQTSILGQDSSLPEPPSPVSVSVLSDKPSTTAREQSRLSMADEKPLADRGSVSLETGTPPPAESHPAVSSPTSAASAAAPQTPVHNAALPQTKAMNFKDVMALSTPLERIEKYGEARQILAARDSGLDTWLVHMTTEHPELPASKSVPGQTSQSTNNAALPVGSQPSGQQPQYQHSPSTAGPQSGGGGGGARSRLGGLSMPSQMSGSALSHSGKEIGNKSKEFMHSAGKMGKGLLSKGKSKLRGSGDKVDTVPPEHPAGHKPHRRSTWRFSLEPRPQDEPAPHTSSVDMIETTPPQLPDPSPISPLNAASGPGSAFPWAVENDMPHQDVSPVKEFIDDDEHVRLNELVIASSFLPAAYASAEHDEGFFPAGQPGASDVNLDMVTPDDWVVVQHQGEQSQAQRMSGSHRAMATHGIAGPGAAIGSGVGAAAEANAPQRQAWQPPTQNQTQNQPQSGPDTPQRNSSFIGLPPLRRGSTFGPKQPKARRASERFALDDDDDSAHDANGWAIAGADGNSGVHYAQPPLGGGFDGPAAAAPAEALINTNKALPFQPMQGVPLPAAVSFSQGQTPNAGHLYQQPQQQPQPQPQQYPGGANPQFAQVGPQNVPPGMPAPMLSSLVQKPPPTGSWKLEESHLTAPLQVTKKRSGTDIAQQFAYSAYDKELGLEYPAAPMPPAQGPPGRFRSDVPPSSARRYPDLFSLSPAQDPRQQHVRGQGIPPPQMQQGRPPREGAADPRQQQQQQQQGGPESPVSGMTAEERGRRRNSGIFRDIGTRIARATSRERRSSVSDARPRGDEVSEASVATEDASDRKRKRASFFGLAGRPISADQAPRNQAGGEVPTDSQEERKRSLFSGAQLKIGPGNFSRSSTSYSAFEQVAGPGGEANPHKRRISDIAKVSGIAGLFGRSRQDRSSLGAMPTSQQSDDQRQISQASIQAPPMQLPSLDFASDPLESMSSLGFEESFQDYRHEEQPAQKHLVDSQLHSVSPDNFISPQDRAVSPLSNIVSAQEGMVPAAVASPPINQLAQGMGQANPQVDQDLAGGEDLEVPPGLKADSTTDEKTPKLEDFIFQEKMAALQLNGLDDNVSEEEISRSQTVSPDISISSNLKAEEHIPERNEILITPPPETSLPAPADSDAINPSAVSKDLPPSINSFPSVSSLREKSDDKSVQEEESSVHQTKEEEAAISRGPSPQIAKSEVSSKVATPASEHQQLHSPALAAVKLSETQNSEPLATPQSQIQLESQQRPESQVPPESLQRPEPQQGPIFQQRPTSQQRLESEQRRDPQQGPDPQQRPESQQRPMSQQRPPIAPDQRQQFQQFHAQVSTVPIDGNQSVLQQRPQYPPSVSVSNASIASEASTPVYSTQQSGSQSLFPGLPVLPGRAFTQPPDGSAQQKESQGSRWKGFRNRVTEQISQKTQPQQQQQQQQQSPQLQQQQSQGKTPVGEKIKGNKLLGALRRTSKQPELVQTQSLEPSPSSRQPPHPNPQPRPQGYQPQPGQVPGQRPPANQYLQPSMQPPNLLHTKTMPAGPVQQQGALPQGQRRLSEPRYESVPIPRGYAAVHGEGRIVPSPYQPNLRQQMPHGQFAPLPPHMQQQQQQQQLQHPHLHPQQHPQQQWQGAHPAPMSYQLHHQPQPQPQPAQYHGGQRSPPMIQGPVSAPLPHERPLHMRFPSDPRSEYFNSQSPSSLNTQNTQHNRHNSQGSQNSRAGLPRPPSDLGSNLGKSQSASPKPSERENLPVVDGLQSASRSPAVSVGADQKPDLKPETTSDKTSESTRPSSLGIDVEKAQQLEEDDLYSATPRKLENGVQPTISRTMSNEQAEGSAAGAAQTNVKRSNTVVAELEDTEEARKRAIRLATQEEKIFYEPEDEMPKMSATSYPGQEWNPFGEQEFTDWREE